MTSAFLNSKLFNMVNIIVRDSMRKSILSKQPGGHKVTAVYSGDVAKTYDKVKYPRAFVSKISASWNNRKLLYVIVDGKPFARFV